MKKKQKKNLIKKPNSSPVCFADKNEEVRKEFIDNEKELEKRVNKFKKIMIH